MAAFFFRCKLVFEMHTANTGLNISFHNFVAVEGAAKPGLRIRDDGEEIIALHVTFGEFDLVRAAQCLLTERGVLDAPITGTYDRATVAAVRAWRERRSMPAGDGIRAEQWMSLLAAGPRESREVASAAPTGSRPTRTTSARR